MNRTAVLAVLESENSVCILIVNAFISLGAASQKVALRVATNRAAKILEVQVSFWLESQFYCITSTIWFM